MVYKLLLPVPEFNHPLRYLAAGFIYTLLGAGLAAVFFPSNLALATVLLIAIGCTPLIYVLVMKEEHLAETSNKFFKQYGKLFQSMISMFFGQLIAFIILYLVLPPQTAQNIFGIQIQNLAFMQAQTYPSFTMILAGHLQLLVVCVILSFLFGVGAIILMTTSAATLAVLLVELPSLSVTGALAAFTMVTLLVSGFICAGFGSGILAAGTANFHITTKKAKKVLTDVGTLLGYSLLLILASTLTQMSLYHVF